MDGEVVSVKLVFRTAHPLTTALFLRVALIFSNISGFLARAHVSFSSSICLQYGTGLTGTRVTFHKVKLKQEPCFVAFVSKASCVQSPLSPRDF